MNQNEITNKNDVNGEDGWILDGKRLKFDPEKEEFVRPGDPRYNNLPRIVL